MTQSAGTDINKIKFLAYQTPGRDFMTDWLMSSVEARNTQFCHCTRKRELASKITLRVTIREKGEINI